MALEIETLKQQLAATSEQLAQCTTDAQRLAQLHAELESPWCDKHLGEMPKTCPACELAESREQLATEKIKHTQAKIKLRGADRLADEVGVFVQLGLLGSRTPPADALLDYRNPPRTERTDRMTDLEQQLAAVTAERDRLAAEGVMLRDWLFKFATRLVCPVNNDCLPGFVAGAHWGWGEARVRILKKLDENNSPATTAEAERVRRLERGIKAVAELIFNSRGVDGLHLNGDVAPWDEIRTGGRFEQWLLDFDEALASLDAAKGGA